jgi:hypothetical protein
MASGNQGWRLCTLAVIARGANVDQTHCRNVKGEPLSAPAGRADDFAWPRREIGRERAKGETPVASTSLDASARAPAASLKSKKASPLELGLGIIF